MRKEQRGFSGYMTVEATFVFVTTLSVIAFALCCGFYQYKKSILEMEACYDVQYSVYLGTPRKEDVVMESNKAYVERNERQSIWMGLWKTKEVEIVAKAEMRTLFPVEVLRLRQRIERAENGRNTEDQSTVSENIAAERE